MISYMDFLEIHLNLGIGDTGGSKDADMYISNILNVL
jgi:hypothetical protein